MFYGIATSNTQLHTESGVSNASVPVPSLHRTPLSSTNISVDRDQLYAEFAPLVKRLLREYGSNAELRKDLVGEIYCRFCALLDAYDPQRGVPLRPYLVRQLTAAVHSYARKWWTITKREVGEDWSVENKGGEPSYDPTASWLMSLCQQQMVRSLPDAIAQLPDRQRKVVCWRYYDERSFEEIAGLLSIEVASARSLLRHGLNNLRKKMQASEEISYTQA